MTRGGVDLGLGFTVTPENVLDAYAVIAEEATRLSLSLHFFRLGLGEGMPRCGGDPVSIDASRGFTQVAGKLAELCYADIKMLMELTDKLANTARSYGMTDQQITAVFNIGEYHYRPSPLLPPPGGTHR